MGSLGAKREGQERSQWAAHYLGLYGSPGKSSNSELLLEITFYQWVFLTEVLLSSELLFSYSHISAYHFYSFPPTPVQMDQLCFYSQARNRRHSLQTQLLFSVGRALGNCRPHSESTTESWGKKVKREESINYLEWLYFLTFPSLYYFCFSKFSFWTSVCYMVPPKFQHFHTVLNMYK